MRRCRTLSIINILSEWVDWTVRRCCRRHRRRAKYKIYKKRNQKEGKKRWRANDDTHNWKMRISRPSMSIFETVANEEREIIFLLLRVHFVSDELTVELMWWTNKHKIRRLQHRAKGKTHRNSIISNHHIFLVTRFRPLCQLCSAHENHASQKRAFTCDGLFGFYMRAVTKRIFGHQLMPRRCILPHSPPPFIAPFCPMPNEPRKMLIEGHVEWVKSWNRVCSEQELRMIYRKKISDCCAFRLKCEIHTNRHRSLSI